MRIHAIAKKLRETPSNAPHSETKDRPELSTSFEVPEGAANVSAQTSLNGPSYYLVVNWAELTPSERAEAMMQHAQPRRVI